MRPPTRARRLREDEAVGRAAAARVRAAAPVEEPQVDARLAGEVREPRLRRGNHPLAGEQPDVLAGVRVAEHHVLAPPAQLELPRVGLVAVQPGHRLGGLLERAAPLEQREDVEAGAGAAGPAVAGRGPEQPRAPGQPQRAQHVGRALGVREDERVDRPGPERGVPARDPSNAAAAPRLGTAVARRTARRQACPRQQLDALLGRRGGGVAGQQRATRLVQLGRVLPHLERREVEAEDARLPQEPVDPALRDELRPEALLDLLEVRCQPVGSVVAGLGRMLAVRAGQGVGEPRLDVGELAPQRLARLVRVAPGEEGRGLRQLLLVALERRRQPLADRQGHAALGERLAQRRDPVGQQRQREHAVRAQRVPDRRRTDIRVAVHVSAGPAAEHERGRRRGPVGRVDGPVVPAGEVGRRVEQHGLEEEEQPPHLVGDARTHGADLVRRVPHRERLADVVLQATALGARRAAGRRGRRGSARRCGASSAPSAATCPSDARSARAGCPGRATAPSAR